MCSVGDDYVEDEEGTSKYMPEIDKSLKLGTTCNKCKKENCCILLRHKDAYCKECFLQGTTHKFKAFLGKHRFIHPNDNVLIIFETGHASAALLHMIRSGLDLTTPKKLKFQPIILYIRRTHKEDLNLINKFIENYKFPSYHISLSDYVKLNKDVNISSILSNDFTKIDEYVDEGVGNSTEAKESLSLFEKKLCVDVARKLNCSCVITNELGIDIASKLLTNISLGRGAHISLDVGPYDDRFDNVKIIRPLRTFEMKELAMYNHFNQNEPITAQGNAINDSSIQNLMQTFVLNLQNNFPATITTIVRTGDKLSLKENLKNNARCQLCQAPLENDSFDVLSSAEATRFSHFLSTQTPNYNLQPVERYNETFNSFNRKTSTVFCFACERLEKNNVC